MVRQPYLAAFRDNGVDANEDIVSNGCTLDHNAMPNGHIVANFNGRAVLAAGANVCAVLDVGVVTNGHWLQLTCTGGGQEEEASSALHQW